METPALPRRLALTAGCNQLINWGSLLYARHFCPRHYRRQGMDIAPALSRPDAGDAGDGRRLPFVARLLARFGGQNVVMSGTLLIAVSCAGMAYTQTLLGWYSAAGDRYRDAPVALRCAIRRAGKPVWTAGAKTISRITLAGGLASAVLAAGRHAAEGDELAACAANLRSFGLLSAVCIRTLPNSVWRLPAA